MEKKKGQQRIIYVKPYKRKQKVLEEDKIPELETKTNFNIFRVVKPLFGAISLSVFLKLLAYSLYYYVVKIEMTDLKIDIERTNLRLVQNLYSRFTTELNIMMQTSIEINTQPLANSCMMLTSVKYFLITDTIQDEFQKMIAEKETETQDTIIEYNDSSSTSFLSNLIRSQTNTVNNYIPTKHFDFYLNKFIYQIRNKFGIGPTLNEIITYMKGKYNNTEDGDVFHYYKRSLRGYHPELFSLRREYNNDMKQTFIELPNDTHKQMTEAFVQRISDLIFDPSTLLCNNIINQERINMNNFKENFIAINGISIKDWSNSIFHPSYGSIVTKLQNSIVKTIFIIILFTTIFLTGMIYRIIKTSLFKEEKRID